MWTKSEIRLALRTVYRMLRDDVHQFFNTLTAQLLLIAVVFYNMTAVRHEYGLFFFTLGAITLQTAWFVFRDHRKRKRRSDG